MIRRGRPTKLESKTVDCIINELERGASRAGAAREAGIDERTLRCWRRKGRESDSGPERYLLKQMDAAEARAKAHIKTKPRDPIPVAVIGATVRTIRDGTRRREPVQLVPAALNHLLELTYEARSGTGVNTNGQRIWYRVYRPRKDRRFSTAQVNLIVNLLRVAVVDETSHGGSIEFEPSDPVDD